MGMAGVGMLMSDLLESPRWCPLAGLKERRGSVRSRHCGALRSHRGQGIPDGQRPLGERPAILQRSAPGGVPEARWGLGQLEAAKQLGVSLNRRNEIVPGKGGIAADTGCGSGGS
jgi:hypothetical protein